MNPFNIDGPDSKCNIKIVNEEEEKKLFESVLQVII